MNIYTHEYLRMQALDKCFKDGSRHYFIDDLIIACNKAVQEQYPDQKNFKKRSIYKDISKMETEEGLANNIEKYLAEDDNPKDLDYLDPSDIHEKQKDKRRKMAYRYKDKSKGLKDLSKIETAQVNDFINILSRIKGRSEYKGLNEIALKLKTELLGDEELPTIMSYDENTRLEGLEHLDAIIEGIKNKEALRITYQPFNADPEEIKIYPYYLKQYNKRWFLFANRKDLKELSYIPIFSIDRIKKITPCHPDKEPFKHLDIHIDEYLKNVIGVSTSFDHTPKSVFLKFEPYRYKYVKSKPLHHSQLTDDSNYTVQLRVILNKELEQLILSYGADVRVISPLILRNQISKISEKMNLNYKKL